VMSSTGCRWKPIRIRARPNTPRVVTATYDVRGRKTASSDPDLGAWTYAYDTASELVSQTDAKGQTTTLSYDKLGRMTGRNEPDLTSTWTYDTAANGIGKLASTSATPPGGGYQKSFAYDSLGRPVQVTIVVNTTNIFNFFGSYDANSRLSTVTYPAGFVATYSYTSLGYSQQVSGGSQVYWTANARDAELRLITQTAGNGVVTTQSFDPLTDRLTSILAGSGNAVESFSYTYDVLGNVLTRADANESLTETLTYDNLNRLITATVSANIAPEKTFSYNAIGNLLTKSDVGTYTYPLAGSALPHAVSSVAGTINSTFSYDPSGNQTAGVGRSISYTSYNKPASIASFWACGRPFVETNEGRHCCRPRVACTISAVRGPLLPAGRREVGRDQSESGLQLRTEKVHGRDDRNRNAGCDQTVFDGSRGRFIPNESLEGIHSVSPSYRPCTYPRERVLTPSLIWVVNLRVTGLPVSCRRKFYENWME
jgi:YD repeat-containing protein